MDQKRNRTATSERYMHRAFLLLIILASSFSGGCSFSTDYVVVNSSSAPVQVIYTIRPSRNDPLAETGEPAMLPTSSITGREWRKLSSTEFTIDRVNRTVTVLLPPDQGLLITRGPDYTERSSTNDFTITEIRIAGSNGEKILKGDAVQKAFVVVPKPFYKFGPPTLLKLTYQ